MSTLGYKHSEETKLKMRGRKMSDESKKKLSLVKKGKPSSQKGIKYSEERIARHSEARKGESNPNWRGGVSSENHSIRNSKEYRLWRIAVFERDDYTCIGCLRRGGQLNADHIKPFSLYPELRFAIDNGRTLCVPCHKTTDTYGGKSKKKI